jgi:hypothetical protein
MMIEKNSDKQRWILWVILGVVLGGGALWLALQPEQPTAQGGGPLVQPPAKPLAKPPEPLTAECLADLHAQQQLARLAVDAMRTYGRIDPGLYDTTSAPGDQSLIRVSKDAQPLLSNEGRTSREGLRPAPIPVEPFNETLRRINADPAAKVFLTAHDAAQRKCGAECPPTVYQVKVTSVDQGKESEAYEFRVHGALPTLAQWEQGFLTQYANVKGSCPFASPIQLDHLEQKILTLEPKEKPAAELPSSADETLEATRKTGGSGDESGHLLSFTGGTVEAQAKCDFVSFDEQCADCQTVQNHNGGYKKRGPKLSCCYATCP